ncbi:MAG: DUF418 domain-containing protein [Planctomycetota bacterium]|nr:DUF418 domain-containing protein [Planctomycetota bacterium]
MSSSDPSRQSPALVPEAPPTAPSKSLPRVAALDVARGFALLGILMVNMDFFGESMASFYATKPENPGMLNAVVFYFTAIFCEGKFYPLFSMLFGMGLVLQMQSVERRGARFVPLYIRRLILLSIMGLSHGFLLWYGDVLFAYSLAGAVLLLARNLSAKALAWIGAGLLAFSTLLTSGLTLLTPPGRTAATSQDASSTTSAATATPGSNQPDEVGVPVKPEQEPTASDGGEATPTEVAPPTDDPTAASPDSEGEPSRSDGVQDPADKDESPVNRAVRVFKAGGDPFSSEEYQAAEIEAYAKGPYSQALFFRSISYVMAIVFSIFGLGWTIVALFCFGAALAKIRIFAPEQAALRSRLLRIGALVGFPLAIGATTLTATIDSPVALAASLALLYLSGPMVAFVYFALAVKAAERGLTIARILATTGRAALSVYISETLLSTFVFYHWGLGKFGTFEHAERALLALAIYALLVIATNLWLRVFAMGPLEYIWRAATYGKLPALLKSRSPAESSEG